MATGSKPTATLRFDFDPPLKEFHFELSRFGQGLSDFTPLWLTLGGLFRQEMAAQFATEGDAGGEHWAPYGGETAPAYELWKAKNYPGRTIGWLTGALMESMTGGPGYSEEFTPFIAKFGQADGAAAAEYGPYFNDGTDKMPARPLLNFTPQQGLIWQKAAVNFVREEYHHSGLGNRMYTTALTEGNANLASGAPIPVD